VGRSLFRCHGRRRHRGSGIVGRYGGHLSWHLPSARPRGFPRRCAEGCRSPAVRRRSR
jgi:hypothetical protein